MAVHVVEITKSVVIAVLPAFDDKLEPLKTRVESLIGRFMPLTGAEFCRSDLSALIALKGELQTLDCERNAFVC